MIEKTEQDQFAHIRNAVANARNALPEQFKNLVEELKAEALAEKCGKPQSAETVFHLLEHLAANQRLLRKAGTTPFDATFRIRASAV